MKMYTDFTEFYGTLRITNPKTLDRWKQNGEYQKLIDAGYIYADGCGRFREEICECCKCKKLKNKKNE